MEYGTQAPTEPTSARGRARNKVTETKQAFKTTEFWIYVIAVLAVLIAGLASDGDDAGGSDGFGSDRVWLYVTLLTIGYMISRGLAKAGSHDPYTDDPYTGTQDTLGDRVKAAAQVLKEGDSGSHPTAVSPESERRL
jgi:hypothetical protein